MKILEIVKEWLRMPEEIRRLRELNQALVTTNTVLNNELHTIKKDLLACQQSNLPDKKASYWNNKWVKNEVKYLARAGFEMDVRNLILTKSYILQPVADKLKRSSHDETVLAIHDYVKKRLIYTPDITENGVEEWWEDSEICWSKKRGDCLMGDTPIIISRNGMKDIIEIEELMPEQWSQDTLFPTKNVDVYCSKLQDKKGCGKFAKINFIVKKKTDKNIYRIRSKKSVFDVTEDHLILTRHSTNSTRLWLEAKDIKKKNIRRINDLSKLFSNKISGTYGRGYAYGLFAAEGYCSDRGVWRIYNTDIKLLEKAKKYLEEQLENHERICGLRSLRFEIKLFNCFKKGEKTNLSQRTKDLFVLTCKAHKGSLIKFTQKFRKMFYTRSKRKRVPQSILEGSNAMKQGFLDGFWDGDKNNTTSKILAFGIVVLNECLGNKNCSIVDKTKNLLIHTNKAISRRSFNSKYLGKTDKFVYDINVAEPHIFTAGDVFVHNCDDGSILIASLAVLAGIPSYKIKCCAGNVQDPNNAEGIVGHLYNIYLASDDEWYVIDWTYWPEKSKNNFLKVSHKERIEYKSIWFTFNNELSWANQDYSIDIVKEAQ